MSNVEQIGVYYSKKENKEKLLALLKSSGTFIRLCPIDGFIYTVNVGNFESQDVVLEVGIKSGNIAILNPELKSVLSQTSSVAN